MKLEEECLGDVGEDDFEREEAGIDARYPAGGLVLVEEGRDCLRWAKVEFSGITGVLPR